MDATGGETGVTGEGGTSSGAVMMVGDEGTEKVKVNNDDGGDIVIGGGDRDRGEGATMGETICETLSQIG
jgi:hypothetical protein